MNSLQNADSYSQTLFEGLPEFEPGWVWLVGGGPGDRGLLTLHAVNAIRQADVIVYDALVDETILTFAKSDVVVEFARETWRATISQAAGYKPAFDRVG